MNLDSIIYWATIFIGIIISLVAGGIVANVGFNIWKKRQLNYKKIVAYNTLVSSLTLLCNEMINFFEVKDKTESKIKDFINKTLDNYGQIINGITDFIFYFGEEYHKPLVELINLYPNLKYDLSLNMTKDEFNKYISDRLDLILNSNKNVK